MLRTGRGSVLIPPGGSAALALQGIELGCGYRLDLLVEGSVIVEVKAVELLLPVHSAQLLTYLKNAGKQVGLLINFDVPVLKDGIRRMVNDFAEQHQ